MVPDGWEHATTEPALPRLGIRRAAMRAPGVFLAVLVVGLGTGSAGAQPPTARSSAAQQSGAYGASPAPPDPWEPAGDDGFGAYRFSRQVPSDTGGRKSDLRTLSLWFNQTFGPGPDSPGCSYDSGPQTPTATATCILDWWSQTDPWSSGADSSLDGGTCGMREDRFPGESRRLRILCY